MSSYEGVDPYAVLGVQPGADSDTVRSAWKEAARKHHPDAGGDSEMFKQAQWAFETIASGAAQSPKRGRGGENTGPTGQQAAHDIEHDGETGELVVVETMITHSMAVFGGTAKVTRWRMSHCPECGGGGVRCETCNGDGRVGRYYETVFTIPARSMHGDVVRVEGGGDAGRRRRSGTGKAVSNAGPYGHLDIRLLVQRDGVIREVGDDLVTEVKINAYDALLGVETMVRGLDGTYRAILEPGTQPGQRARIAGRGRPREDGGRGDLIAVVNVEIMQDLGSAERDTLRQLRRERQLRTGNRS